MAYKIAADIVVAIHLGWVFFLIFGALAGRYIRWLKWLHLSGLGFSLFIQVFSFYCPLTYLEIFLRSQHDPALTYTGSFIARVMEQVVYWEVPRGAVMIGTLGVVVFSFWLYRKDQSKS